MKKLIYLVLLSIIWATVCFGQTTVTVITDGSKTWQCTTSGSSPPIPAKYTISTTVVTPAGGSVTPASQTVDKGSMATFTVTINAGYTTSVSEGSLSGTIWTIPNITSTHTATITFLKPTPTPVDGELLPWGTGVGSTYVIYGAIGVKKTYIIRVPEKIAYARVYLQAYLPSSAFQTTFRPPTGYKYYGLETYVHTVRYSSAEDLALYPGVITPLRTDGFLPPGDYIAELLWTGSGPIMIQTVD